MEFNYRILALDQALSHTGYAFVQADSLQIVHGLIETTKKNVSKKNPWEYSDWERMSFVLDKVLYLIKYFKPTHIILETPFVRQKFKSALQLQQVYAVLQVGLRKETTAEIGSISAKSWPGIIWMSSTKAPILDLVEPYGVKTDHESDAIGLACASLVQYRFREDLCDTESVTTFLAKANYKNFANFSLKP